MFILKGPKVKWHLFFKNQYLKEKEENLALYSG